MREASAEVFPLLAEPSAYRPCELDLAADAEARSYWLALFRRHFATLLRQHEVEAADRGVGPHRVAAQNDEARRRFFDWLDRQALAPGSDGPLNVLSICLAREDVLDAVGIDDAYRLAKAVENDKALEMLPALLAELDAIDAPARNLALAQGVFAGNIYDLGATSTINLHDAGRTDFHAVRAKLKPRPWHTDTLDAWLRRLDGDPHRAAVLFVDNAGPDVVLGMLPFARELLRRGTEVILTANTEPALNDITHAELVPLAERVAAFDAVMGDAFAEGRLKLVPSGNRAPLIDLTRISPELAAACRVTPIDLVVLEGMGRGVESNWHARFTCEALNFAMIKDEQVAAHINAGLFDLVFKYR